MQLFKTEFYDACLSMNLRQRGIMVPMEVFCPLSGLLHKTEDIIGLTISLGLGQGNSIQDRAHGCTTTPHEVA
jgi:hypothetical protein